MQAIVWEFKLAATSELTDADLRPYLHYMRDMKLQELCADGASWQIADEVEYDQIPAPELGLRHLARWRLLQVRFVHDS